MFCVRNIQRACVSLSSVRVVVPKANYSRRNDRNTSCYKPIRSSNDKALDDVEDGIFGDNPNWELLTPHGFRFYLPGGIGPGWLDASTTAQVEIYSEIVPNDSKLITTHRGHRNKRNVMEEKKSFTLLQCTAQECPSLLRKDILELFPNSMEVASPQLTIVTITQNSNYKKTKWSKEIETEMLTKCFVLAASDVCNKLRKFGYWADFINPFSGQPYTNPQKSSTLYSTDERFRCVGFTVDKQNSCKVISQINDSKNFIGNLYTNAPYSNFLWEMLHDDD